MRNKKTLLFIAFLGVLFAASTCYAQMYTVTDLGTLGGSWSEATAMNASGQVVGTSQLSDGFWSTFRTAPNSQISPSDDVNTRHCPSMPCLEFATPYDVNDSGQVVGMVYDFSSIDWLPFRTAPNGTLDSAEFDNFIGRATSINNSGDATVIFDGNPTSRISYRWPHENLGTLAPQGWNSYGTGQTWASAINDSGQVAGSSDIGDNWPYTGSSHAFRTAPNSSINPATDDLGTLGGTNSYGYAMNAFGQVVGSSQTAANAAWHAFRTAPNSAISPAADDLGTLDGGSSAASAIDAYGQVVGYSIVEGASHAFVYSNGIMQNVNNLIPSASSCGVLEQAVDINAVGQIAANETCNGQAHAVRLDPIYRALVRQPINADGSSVFSAKRGVVPVKFTLMQYGQPTCSLLPATVAITRASGDALVSVDESTYLSNADDGSNFRIDPTACQYIYNLSTSSLGVGTYRVDISINAIFVGHATFALN